MTITARGVLAGLIIAPALAAALCVFGMMIHFVATDAQGAALPVGELAPLAGRIWVAAMMFAYPAALLFLVLWAASAALRIARFGAVLSGALAGFAAVAVYLDRTHPGGLLEGLAGTEAIAALTLGEFAGALVLPLIGAASGAMGGLAFALFARR